MCEYACGGLLYACLICIEHNPAYIVYGSYYIISLLSLPPPTILQILYPLTPSTLIHSLTLFKSLYSQSLTSQEPEPCPSKLIANSQSERAPSRLPCLASEEAVGSASMYSF